MQIVFNPNEVTRLSGPGRMKKGMLTLDVSGPSLNVISLESKEITFEVAGDNQSALFQLNLEGRELRLTCVA